MLIGELVAEMTEYFGRDPKRVGHFLKVSGFAKTIAECEGLPEDEMEVLQIASVIHDIDVPEYLHRYADSKGKIGDVHGTDVAKEVLEQLECSPGVISRVCYLVDHQHSVDNVEGRDGQILLEAELLVNLYEDDESLDTAKQLMNSTFKTHTGKMMLQNQFL